MLLKHLLKYVEELKVSAMREEIVFYIHNEKSKPLRA